MSERTPKEIRAELHAAMREILAEIERVPLLPEHDWEISQLGNGMMYAAVNRRGVRTDDIIPAVEFDGLTLSTAFTRAVGIADEAGALDRDALAKMDGVRPCCGVHAYAPHEEDCGRYLDWQPKYCGMEHGKTHLIAPKAWSGQDLTWAVCGAMGLPVRDQGPVTCKRCLRQLGAGVSDG